MRIRDRIRGAIKGWSAGQVGAGGYFGSQAQQQYGYDGAYGHFYQLQNDYFVRLLDTGNEQKVTYQTLSKAALQNPIATACIRLIVESLSEIELEAVKENTGGDRDVATDHPIMELLFCNGRTLIDFLEPLLMHMHYGGEIFLHRPIALTGSEYRPLGLDTICPSKFIGFIYKGIDEPQGFSRLIRGDVYRNVVPGGIVGYRFHRSQNRGMLVDDDCNVQSIDTCKHYYRYNPFQEYRGLPLVYGAGSSLNLIQMGMNWNTNLARTGGRIPGFMTPEGLKPGQSITPEQRTRIEADFDRRIRERQERNLPMVLSGTMKYVDSNITPRDADWLNSEKHGGRKICAAHRVPPILVGDVDSVGLGGGSGTKSANKNLYLTCLLPLLDIILGYLNSGVVAELGDDYRLCYNRDRIDALQEEEEKRDKRLVGACGGPFMTVNEARINAGLDPMEGEEYDIIREPKAPAAGKAGEEGEGEGKGEEDDDDDEGRITNNMNERWLR